MQTAIKARGETPFEEAGEGVVLRFKNSDLKRLEAELGTDWFQSMLDKFLHGLIETAMVETLVRHGAKKDGQPFQMTEENFDNIPIDVMGEKVMDAACISKSGMNAREHIADRFKAFAEVEESEIPRQSPDGTSSTISDGSVSGPGSE